MGEQMIQPHNTYSCKNVKDTDFFFLMLFQDLLFKWTSMNMLYLKVQKDTKNGIPDAASSSASFSDASETARNHWEIKPHTNQINLSVLLQPIQDQVQTISVCIFLFLLFVHLSCCRLYDGKSLLAICNSPLDKQQLGHPWGSETQSGSVTN